MTKKVLVFTLLWLAICLASPTALAKEGCWFTTKEGVRVWNVEPQDGETASWSGRRDKSNYAKGTGILKWFVAGKLTEICTCTMVDGKIEGPAKIVWADGQDYSGEVHDSELSGLGLLSSKEGWKYQGEFTRGALTGRATFSWPDGTSYEGDFLNGLPHGQGLLKWKDGGVYKGDFVAGKRTGKGSMRWPNGNIYEGEFVDGQCNGQGIFTWTDGAVYEGSFLVGKRTGLGIIRWPDGSRYEGGFSEGVLEGQGKLYDKSGTLLSVGNWSNNEFVY